jgi:hypothetical protein
MSQSPFLPPMYAPDSPEEINRAQREGKPEPQQIEPSCNINSRPKTLIAFSDSPTSSLRTGNRTKAKAIPNASSAGPSGTQSAPSS